ncbi:MAG TPA: EAL domain-containing protein, partial [Burkholderiaceae bacterium]|nr:EAL domain-containing protein [Burkholderiaceae bacterium]
RVIYGRQGYHQPRYESTLTITDPSQKDGEPLTGFAFMPAAVRLGLSAEFDLRAVRLALAWLADNSTELVVRVSVSSLLKEGFIQTVRHALTAGQAPDGKSVLSRLIIELDAYGVSTYPAEVREFCEMVHDAGVRVGVRGVAQHLDVVARLEALPVVYIKLAGGFIEDLGTSQGAVSLLNAVAHTATAARIHILVDDMPSEAAAMLLRDHGAQFRITKND